MHLFSQPVSEISAIAESSNHTWCYTLSAIDGVSIRIGDLMNVVQPYEDRHAGLEAAQVLYDAALTACVVVDCNENTWQARLASLVHWPR